MPNHDRQGDKVATWLLEKALIDLENVSEEPTRFEESDEVAVVDWQRLFPGKRPKRNTDDLTPGIPRSHCYWMRQEKK